MRSASSWVRSVARQGLMHAARRLLGAQQSDWAQAMQAEVAALDDEREALAFAWGCFSTALGHAIGAACDASGRLHNSGVLACSVSVLLGCAFMHSADAPSHYVWMNVASLAFAVATFRLLPLQRLQSDHLLRARLALAMGALLLLNSLGQTAVDASGWLRLSALPLNLSWLLLPALLVATDLPPRDTARPWALAGLGMAVGALTLQADPVMLALVAAVLSLRAWHRRSRALSLLAWATWALAALLSREWQQPEALRFVDQVLHSGFEQSPALGLALALLQLLPLWPTLRQRRSRVHGLVWALLVSLSVPGWLPSMLVGYGGSFIVAYLLSLALVGDGTEAHPASGRPPPVARPRSPMPPLHRSKLT